MMAPPDFDTMPSGSIKIMSDKDLEIQRLKAEIERLEARNVELVALVKMGEAAVMDFMPNIGRCALQDYYRLNKFLMKAAQEKP